MLELRLAAWNEILGTKMRDEGQSAETILLELDREEAYELLLRSMQSCQEDNSTFGSALRKLSDALERRQDCRKAA